MSDASDIMYECPSCHRVSGDHVVGCAWRSGNSKPTPDVRPCPGIDVTGAHYQSIKAVKHCQGCPGCASKSEGTQDRLTPLTTAESITLRRAAAIARMGGWLGNAWELDTLHDRLAPAVPKEPQ